MRKILAVAAVLMVSTSGMAMAEDLEFTLINKSDSHIVGFYVSPSNTNNWEDNLLSGAYLPAGNQVDVLIADGRTTCVYDIRTEFKDGATDEEFGLDLCDLGSYTFE